MAEVHVVCRDKYRFKKLNLAHFAWFNSQPPSRERVEEYCLKIDQKGKKGRKQS